MCQLRPRMRAHKHSGLIWSGCLRRELSVSVFSDEYTRVIGVYAGVRARLFLKNFNFSVRLATVDAAFHSTLTLRGTFADFEPFLSLTTGSRFGSTATPSGEQCFWPPALQRGVFHWLLELDVTFHDTIRPEPCRRVVQNAGRLIQENVRKECPCVYAENKSNTDTARRG